MRRDLVLVGVLGGLLGSALILAGSASAHATLVSSDPLDGARLKAGPSSVSITFDEKVGLGSLGYLHVINQQGKRVESGGAYHPNGSGAKVAVNLPSGLPDGTYTESYRVVSADSHPIAGVVRFGPAQRRASRGPSQSQRAPQWCRGTAGWRCRPG